MTDEQIDRLLSDAASWIPGAGSGDSNITSTLAAVSVANSLLVIAELMFRKEKRDTTSSRTIDPFDYVKPCEENCTPERHAIHEAQWDMATRIAKDMERVL